MRQEKEFSVVPSLALASTHFSVRHLIAPLGRFMAQLSAAAFLISINALCVTSKKQKHLKNHEFRLAK